MHCKERIDDMTNRSGIVFAKAPPFQIFITISYHYGSSCLCSSSYCSSDRLSFPWWYWLEELFNEQCSSKLFIIIIICVSSLSYCVSQFRPFVLPLVILAGGAVGAFLYWKKLGCCSCCCCHFLQVSFHLICSCSFFNMLMLILLLLLLPLSQVSFSWVKFDLIDLKFNKFNWQLLLAL